MYEYFFRLSSGEEVVAHETVPIYVSLTKEIAPTGRVEAIHICFKKLFLIPTR